jgi:hypothetical protein
MSHGRYHIAINAIKVDRSHWVLKYRGDRRALSRAERGTERVICVWLVLVPLSELDTAGLLERDKQGVGADYDAFDARMRVALRPTE